MRHVPSSLLKRMAAVPHVTVLLVATVCLSKVPPMPSKSQAAVRQVTGRAATTAWRTLPNQILLSKRPALARLGSGRQETIA